MLQSRTPSGIPVRPGYLRGLIRNLVAILVIGLVPHIVVAKGEGCDILQKLTYASGWAKQIGQYLEHGKYSANILLDVGQLSFDSGGDNGSALECGKGGRSAITSGIARWLSDNFSGIDLVLLDDAEWQKVNKVLSEYPVDQGRLGRLNIEGANYIVEIDPEVREVSRGLYQYLQLNISGKIIVVPKSIYVPLDPGGPYSQDVPSRAIYDGRVGISAVTGSDQYQITVPGLWSHGMLMGHGQHTVNLRFEIDNEVGVSTCIGPDTLWWVSLGGGGLGDPINAINGKVTKVAGAAFWSPVLTRQVCLPPHSSESFSNFTLHDFLPDLVSVAPAADGMPPINVPFRGVRGGCLVIAGDLWTKSQVHKQWIAWAADADAEGTGGSGTVIGGFYDSEPTLIRCGWFPSQN